MAEKDKVTIMVLKVDLQCCRCYKKVKKVLCQFPQIRDQKYDEKANTVTISVVCCSPETIRDKLCCKGGGSIKSIEIKPPPKPKDLVKEPGEIPKEPEKKPEKSKEADKKKPEKPKEHKKETPELALPTPIAYPPIGFCCTECYHGHCGGGPYYFGEPPPHPRPCYGTCGRPVYDSWGCNYKYYYVSHGDCFSEENPQACSVM